MKRPDWTYGFFYRAWSRLLHRFELHQTRSNVMEDGATVTRCEWCGLSQRKARPVKPSSPASRSPLGAIDQEETDG